MNTNLAKGIFSILVLGLMGATSAKANMELNCIDLDHGPGFSVSFPAGQGAGYALVELADGQELQGSYKSEIIGGSTRLAGATSINILAHSQLPDYGKPHSISVSIFGYEGRLSGHAEVTSLTGQSLAEIFVSCAILQ